MCGIAGIVSDSPGSLEHIDTMLDTLVHRGPDGGGVHVAPGAVLGHVRLSIIGLDSGAQPMTIPGTGCWITYNGECFNYRELRRELEILGMRFRTESDTEVVLAAFVQWGPACLERFNGQFAFAVWDERTRSLFLARDRVGIRPLYYTRTQEGFLFASEPKALFAHPGADRVPDPEGLAQVFTLWGPMAPRTVFAGVHQLEPGHWMLLSDRGIRTVRYWSLPEGPDRFRFARIEEAVEELSFLMNDAVRIRLRSDVEVGAYISGGLDSSIIAMHAARHVGGMRTFSLGFSDSGFDESGFQDTLFNRLGVGNRRMSITEESIRSGLERFVHHCECPVLRTAPVPMMLLSGLVRDAGVKVALTGEGADELFGGYNIFKEARVRMFWARQPESSWRGGLVRRLFPYVFKDPRAGRLLHHFYASTLDRPEDLLFSHRVRWERSAGNLSFFRPDVLQKVEFMPGDKGADSVSGTPSFLDPCGFAAVDPYLSQRDSFSRAQSLETSTFLSSYLLSSQGDRPAMANSVEIRLPFLDPRIMELAFSLPSRWKMRGLNEKYILKKTFGPMLPKSIASRTKHPYRAPLKPVLHRDFLDTVLSRTALDQVGLFDTKKVELLVRRISAPGGNAGEFQMMALMGILTTQMLFQHP